MMFDPSQLLATTQSKWLVTGAAGFIGSNLTIALLKAGQIVRGIDNFATGHRRNLDDISREVGSHLAKNFEFVDADIRDEQACLKAVQGNDYVLHQAALGSVPRSIADPLSSHRTNVDGFVNVLNASTQAKVKRFVYASSSSVYGDSETLPKVEDKTGRLLSPYAATKAINETYASVFQRTYGLPCVGLRYFNVFGPRQDPNGQYAAVIPRWITALLSGTSVIVNGDGSTSRDFCYIDNVIQANLRAALRPESFEQAEIFNIACGSRTTLIELAEALRVSIALAKGMRADEMISKIEHIEFRKGDVLHSLADTSKATRLLGYKPTHSLAQGLAIISPWYNSNRDRLK